MRDRVPAEGRAIVTYSAREVSFADGEKVTLRVPQIEFQDLQFGELGRDIMISPRIAPAVVGLGLLEAVPEATILESRQGTRKAGRRRQAELRVGLRGRADRARTLRLESESTQPAPTDRERVPRRHRRDLLAIPGGELPGGAEAMPGCALREQMRRPRRLHRELPAGGDPEPAQQHHPLPAGARGPCPAQRERRRSEARRGRCSPRPVAAPATCPN